MRKQMIAIVAQARKIDARNGGSITKNSIAPETIARIVAMIATAMLTFRNWSIGLALST